MGHAFCRGRSRDVYGLDPEPLDTWYDRFTAGIAPEDRGRWVESIKDVVLRITPWEFEGRFIRPTGEEMYIRGISQPVRLKDETVWNGILLDITDRWRAEALLNQQFQFLQHLIDTIPNPVFYKDTTGIYTGCNRAFEEYIGLPKDQIIGKSVYQIAPAELAGTYFAMDKETLRSSRNPDLRSAGEVCRRIDS